MNKFKIVYFVAGPLTSRWLDYYCLDELSNNAGFCIEYWDCADILVDGGYKVTQIISRPYTKKIISFKHFKREISKLPKDTIFISEIYFAPETKKFTRIISKYLKYHVDINIWSSVIKLLEDNVEINNIASNHKEQNVVTFKSKLYRYNIVKIINKFMKYGFTQPFYEFINSLKEQREFKTIQRYVSKFYTTHISYLPQCKYRILHPDYIKYAKIKDKEPIIKEPYIVFVGQFFPYHPDLLSYQFDGEINDIAQEYYNLLNDFFTKLEKVYRCKVVIAEHPSGKFDVNPYDGRNIYYYKTADLIKDSIAVCVHYSNSISFAALFNKPIAILANNAIQKCPTVYGRISEFANILKTPLIHIDTDVDFQNLFHYIENDDRKKIVDVLEYDDEMHNSNANLYAKYFSDIYNRIKNNNHA